MVSLVLSFLQVLVLASNQVFLYGLMAVSMPLFWAYPGIALVGRLDYNWVYRPCAPPLSHNIICFVNYILEMPAYWLQVWWCIRKKKMSVCLGVGWCRRHGHVCAQAGRSGRLLCLALIRTLLSLRDYGCSNFPLT